MSANSDKEEPSAKNLSSKDQSSGGAGTGGSKWVSGGFDLEEHIAQLPQLGDTHLLNALSHSKANKTTLNANKNGSNDLINHLKPQNDNNCSVNELNVNQMSDTINSDINEDNDITVKNRHSNQLNDNTLRHLQNEVENDSIDSDDKRTTRETRPHEDVNRRNDSPKQKDDSITINSNNVSDLVNQSLPTTQGIEFSDGLAALAEVALQQQRNSV